MAGLVRGSSGEGPSKASSPAAAGPSSVGGGSTQPGTGRQSRSTASRSTSRRSWRRRRGRFVVDRHWALLTRPTRHTRLRAFCTFKLSAAGQRPGSRPRRPPRDAPRPRRTHRAPARTSNDVPPPTFLPPKCRIAVNLTPDAFPDWGRFSDAKRRSNSVPSMHGTRAAQEVPAVRGAGLVRGPRTTAGVVLEPVPEHRRGHPPRSSRGGRSDPDDRRCQGAKAASRACPDEGGTGRVGALTSGWIRTTDSPAAGPPRTAQAGR